jgi:glutathione S-transferase
MDLTLYYAPHTRAGRVRWLLEELGVPYEIRRVDHKHDPSYREIHPLALVPALVVDGKPMIESAAMMIYLADRFADRGLAPALDAPDRGAYLQWIVFTTTTLEPPLVQAFFPSGAAPDADAKARLVARFHAAAAVIEASLADGREYLVGGRLPAADLPDAHVLGGARAAGVLAAPPRLVEYGRRLGGRPAAKAARAD